MARLGLLLPLLMAVATVSVVTPAAADTHGEHLFNLLPRSRLHELSFDNLEATLDMLTDLLEERSLPSGGKGYVSRMVVPTLYADSALCRRHTQIYWQQFTTGAPTIWPQLSKWSQ